MFAVLFHSWPRAVFNAIPYLNPANRKVPYTRAQIWEPSSSLNQYCKQTAALQCITVKDDQTGEKPVIFSS